MMTGNGNIPYICCFQLSCFAKENTKQSDHAGRAAASLLNILSYELYNIYFILYDVSVELNYKETVLCHLVW